MVCGPTPSVSIDSECIEPCGEILDEQRDARWIPNGHRQQTSARSPPENPTAECRSAGR
jgi:hypothetical protein